MKRLLRWLVPAGFRGQVAAILILGVLLSQVIAGALYLVALPQWQRVLRPDLAVTKGAMVVKYCSFSSAIFLRQRSLPSLALSEMNQPSGLSK